LFCFELGEQMMSVAKDCQRYAAQCLQDARTTVDPRQKVFLVEMAQAWQRLAERETHARNVYACPVSEFDRGDRYFLLVLAFGDEPGAIQGYLAVAGVAFLQ
jgi:hypothetical protein